MRTQHSRAFTLIELLIVVAIIAILAAIAVPNFLEAQTRSKVARVHADMRSVATAIEAYAVDHNVPPLAIQNYPNFKMACWPLVFEADGTGPNRPAGSYGFLSLTTPIAYMTGLPRDPFMNGAKFDTTAMQLPDARNIGFLFINFHGAYKFTQRQKFNPGIGKNIMTAPLWPVAFNGSDKAASVAWVMVSPGPDRQLVDPSSPDSGINLDFDVARTFSIGWPLVAWSEGAATTYDPTNGTASTGQIIRTSGGIAAK